MKIIALLAGLLGMVLAPPGNAAHVRVAVAADFSDPAREIASRFHAQTGHKASLSFATTAQLFARIASGAPYDILLAADAEYPKRAVSEGLAEHGSRFTYAVGRLALWTRSSDTMLDGKTLRDGDFRHIAIPNPATTPYGAAAVEALQNMRVFAHIQTRILQGQDMAQTYRLIASRRAQVGIVALSEIMQHRLGSWWEIPVDLYSPVLQQAVLLKKGANEPAARAFMAFLRGPEARAILDRHGYAAE
jgi:molybdate transport system substrate-binding protein